MRNFEEILKIALPIYRKAMEGGHLDTYMCWVLRDMEIRGIITPQEQAFTRWRIERIIGQHFTLHTYLERILRICPTGEDTILGKLNR